MITYGRPIGTGFSGATLAIRINILPHRAGLGVKMIWLFLIVAVWVFLSYIDWLSGPTWTERDLRKDHEKFIKYLNRHSGVQK